MGGAEDVSWGVEEGKRGEKKRDGGEIGRGRDARSRVFEDGPEVILGAAQELRAAAKPE